MDGEIKVQCRPAGAEAPGSWLVQAQTAGGWTTEILRGGATEKIFVFRHPPDTIAVTAIDRCGNATSPVVVERRVQPDAKGAP